MGTLSDRILSCKNNVDECGDEQDYMECAAYNAALEMSAKLAAEADELIENLLLALLEAKGWNWLDEIEPPDSVQDEVHAAINQYREFRDK